MVIQWWLLKINGISMENFQAIAILSFYFFLMFNEIPLTKDNGFSWLSRWCSWEYNLREYNGHIWTYTIYGKQVDSNTSW